jgi:hypothetical protein
MNRRKIGTVRHRLVALIIGNLALLVVMPEAALSSHGRPYDGEWIVGALALSMLVITVPVFVSGVFRERVAGGVLSLLPLVNVWELGCRGIPME